MNLKLPPKAQSQCLAALLEYGPAIASEAAGASSRTVSALLAAGYVTRDAERRLHLTVKGRSVAEEYQRQLRHRLDNNIVSLRRWP